MRPTPQLKHRTLFVYLNMSRRVFIEIWLLIFSLLCILAGLSAHVPTSDDKWVYIVDNDGDFEVLSKEEYIIQWAQNNNTDFAIANTIYEPDIIPGPIKDVFELYVKESAFSSGYPIYPRGQMLTNDQKDRAYEALVLFAQSDPEMIPFRPGQLPQTRFSFVLLGQSFFRLFIFAILSLIPTLVIRFCLNYELKLRRRGKKRQGLCGWCGYSCKELESPKCPECGKLHGVPTSGHNSTEPVDA